MGKGQDNSWVGWEMIFWRDMSLFARPLSHLWGEGSPPDAFVGDNFLTLEPPGSI